MKRDQYEVDNNAFFKESISMQDILNEKQPAENDLMNITIKSRNLATIINQTDKRSIIDRNIKIIKNLNNASDLKIKSQFKSGDESLKLFNDDKNIRNKLNNKQMLDAFTSINKKLIR